VSEEAKHEQIANVIHEVLHEHKLTYYEALGILEVVKSYYVTRICQLNGAAQITVHKVNK